MPTQVYKDFEYAFVFGKILTVTKYNGTSTDIVLPTQIEGKYVKEYRDEILYRSTSFSLEGESPYFCEFEGNLYSHDMKTLIAYASKNTRTRFEIPEGVETVGGRAIQWNNYLEEIIIPSTVKRIEDAAFLACSKIKRLELPSALEYINGGATEYCYSLTDIVIKDGVNYKSIGGILFSADTKKLVRYPTGRAGAYFRIPEFVDTVLNDSMSVITDLEEIDIPQNVKVIEDFAFHHNTRLRSVHISDGVAKIGENAFIGNENLTVMCQATRKGENWHYRWSGLSEDAVRWGVKDPISDEYVPLVGSSDLDFDYYSKGDDYKLPTRKTHENDYEYTVNGDTVTITGRKRGGDELFIPAKIEGKDVIHIDIGLVHNASRVIIEGDSKYFRAIDGNLYSHDRKTFIAYAGKNTRLEYRLPYETEIIGEGAFKSINALNSIILNKCLREIRSGAFSGVERLYNLVLPDTLVRFNPTAVDGCKSLVAIKASGGAFVDIDGVLYTADKKTLVRYPAGKKDNAYNVRVGTEIIETGAFGTNRIVRKITLPKTVKTVKGVAFSGCHNLAAINIPRSVESVGANIFFDDHDVLVYMERKPRSSFGENWSGINKKQIIISKKMPETEVGYLEYARQGGGSKRQRITLVLLIIILALLILQAVFPYLK